eukprot:2208516-Pyramimonas_sp.AAC.1
MAALLAASCVVRGGWRPLDADGLASSPRRRGAGLPGRAVACWCEPPPFGLCSFVAPASVGGFLRGPPRPRRLRRGRRVACGP